MKDKHIVISDKAKNIFIFLFILIAIELRFYLLYFPIATFGYLVPPGDDAVNHFNIIENILRGDFTTNYPWLFHYAVATISRIGNWPVMDVLKYLTPALVVLPSIAIYIFLKKTFNRTTALIGFTICLWASNYALMAYGDGNYPNIIAGGFFLPLAMLYFLQSFKQRKLSNYVWALVFVLLLLLTHHLSLVCMLAILLVYLIVLGVWNKREKIAKNYKRAAVIIVIILALCAVVVSMLSFKQTFISAYDSLIHNGSYSAGANFAKPIEFADYSAQIGALVFYGGTVSLLYLIYLLGEAKERVNKSAILLILVWFVVVFGLSRLGQTGLPGRFAREAAIPLIMSMAVTLGYFFDLMRNNLQKSFALLFFGLIILINLAQINTSQYTAPEFFNSMIWFTQQDKQAADAIAKLTPEGAVIIANPTTPYLPVFTPRKILFPATASTLTPGDFNDYAKATGARFVFIGEKTLADPDGKTYPFFAEFKERTAQLKSAVVGCTPISEPNSNFAIYDLTTCKTKVKK